MLSKMLLFFALQRQKERRVYTDQDNLLAPFSGSWGPRGNAAEFLIVFLFVI